MNLKVHLHLLLLGLMTFSELFTLSGGNDQRKFSRTLFCQCKCTLFCQYERSLRGVNYSALPATRTVSEEHSSCWSPIHSLSNYNSFSKNKSFFQSGFFPFKPKVLHIEKLAHFCCHRTRCKRSQCNLVEQFIPNSTQT